MNFDQWRASEYGYACVVSSTEARKKAPLSSVHNGARETLNGSSADESGQVRQAVEARHSQYGDSRE